MNRAVLVQEDGGRGQPPLRREYREFRALKRVFPGSWVFIIILLIVAGTLVVPVGLGGAPVIWSPQSLFP
jgi:hypothetical protein